MIKVMIIEDDPMVREINTKFLKKLKDFSLVKSAANLSEAKEFISKKNVELVLLDIYLPKENGIDFLKWLRKEEIQADVILITADKSGSRIQEALRYGAVDYLIKPFTFERFRDALLQFKERYQGFKVPGSIEQDELDKFISGSKASEQENDVAGTELIKGFNKYTYKAIWGEIEKTGEKYTSAEEISEKIGIARVTVRKYLEYMEKEGKVKKLIEYGKIGRPQHKYTMITE
ncbi:MAG: response regulator [Clostridiaceae bacterium]